MKVNKKIFRAYDLRGVVDEDLTPEFFEHLGKAYATFLKRNSIDNTVIVARDARKTSDEYSKALINGVISTGLNVVDIGMTFVGTFYWSQYYLKHKGGVCITASHNPKNYNGAKLSVDFSETMVTAQMTELCRLVEEEDYDHSKVLGSVEVVDVTEAYIDDLKSRITIPRQVKVLVDTSYSTGGAIVPEVFKSFGLEVIERHTKVDHELPLDAPDPTDTELAERLSQEVKETDAEVGFCYDSDGDRIGVVDEKGTIVWNDMLVALIAIEVLRKHPGSTIMFNSLCSRAVPITISKHGGIPYMWRTGHSFLKKKNQEVGAAFIGELSGHFFFSKDFYNHDDGIYTSLKLLSLLANSDKKLSSLINELPKFVSSPEIKVGYPDDKKVEMVTELTKLIKNDYPNATVIDYQRMGDGVRFETDSSMFVVRYSQNGPYITVKIEAETTEEYEKLRKYISTLFSKYNEFDWTFGVSQELLQI